MRYPYPGLDGEKHEKTYNKELSSIAHTKAQTHFCESFHDVWVKDFDDITRDFCRDFRKQNCSSVDAIYCANRALYFIEFKDRSLHAMNCQGCSGDKDEPIEVELSKKAQDSLFIVGSTLLRDMTMEQIQQIAHLIVVYNDTPPSESDPYSFGKIADEVKGFARPASDCYNVTVLWDMNRFKTAKFYKTVHTWNEAEFKRLAPNFMARQDGTSNF